MLGISVHKEGDELSRGLNIGWCKGPMFLLCGGSYSTHIWVLRLRVRLFPLVKPISIFTKETYTLKDAIKGYLTESGVNAQLYFLNQRLEQLEKGGI